MDCTMPGHPVHHQLPEFTQTHIHWVGDAIQPSHALSSPSPLTYNLSQHQGLLQWVSSLHQVAKVWSFSFNISPSNEHSGLISFRMDWLDLLAVQGVPKARSFRKTEKSLQETSLKRQKASLPSQMPLAYLTRCLIGSEDALASPEAGHSLMGW